MLLAIETSEAACSTALIIGEEIVDRRHEIVGRGHAERLLPMIAELIGDRKPDAIVVDCGPGSFTGVRVGLAAARGLGLAWSIPVTGFSSTALIAASVFRAHDHAEITIAMNGGHGQLFVESFRREPFGSLGPLASLYPDAAVESADICHHVTGSGATLLVRHGLPEENVVPASNPDAGDVALLGEAFRSFPPRPIYGRAPDARPVAP